MKSIAIYGAGGFGKEVKGMLERQTNKFSFAGFIDDFKKEHQIIPDSDFLLIALANPLIREQIAERWHVKEKLNFALISPDCNLHSTINIGEGTIICPGVQLTVDISVGKFVIINLNSTIGHDVTIGNFTSIMPSVNISGNVTIGEKVFIGTGATILQGINIGRHSIIGAGAVVTRDVPEGATVVGVPARVTKKNR